MPEIEPVPSKLPLLIAANIIALAGVAVVLALAAFSTPVWFWLFGSMVMTFGLLLRRVSGTTPKSLRMTSALLQSLEDALLFLDLIVLVKFVIDWMIGGPANGPHLELLLWAGGLTIGQIGISKVRERITPRKAAARK